MIEPRSLSRRMLAPNIGFVKVATFPGAVGQSFARALDQAIRDLKDHGVQRLIVDIRGNIGGGLADHSRTWVGVRHQLLSGEEGKMPGHPIRSIAFSSSGRP